MTKGCLFGQPFSVASNYLFLLIFALREFQQCGVRNQHTTTDFSCRNLFACDERVQRSFADANNPSGVRFAVEQNIPVHMDTSKILWSELRLRCGRA